MQITTRHWSGYAAALLLIAGLPAEAQAYGAPGLGLGAATTAFGVVAVLVIAFAFVLWHPLKILFRRLRSSKHDRRD